jgi:hypothetical protein
MSALKTQVFILQTAELGLTARDSHSRPQNRESASGQFRGTDGKPTIHLYCQRTLWSLDPGGYPFQLQADAGDRCRLAAADATVERSPIASGHSS